MRYREAARKLSRLGCPDSDAGGLYTVLGVACIKPIMTTQPNFPDTPSGPAGLMHEQTFNEALADALRARRRAWRDDVRYIIAERQQVFDDAGRERPDILVTPPDIYPVVVEVEWGEPAFGDARRKLGRLVSGTPFPSSFHHRRRRAAGNTQLVKR